MPNSELLINSVEELPHHPEIRILMDIGVGDYVDPSVLYIFFLNLIVIITKIIFQSENTALLKYAFDRFRSDYASSSCAHPQLCADMVKNDGSAVYITVIRFIKN